MPKPPAIISVHAQFPKVVMPHTELDLDPTNWEWKQCLTFPVSRLNDLRLSLKPYKWIRYATGVVVGARGELCTERNRPNPIPINYDTDLSTVSIDLYYHTANQEKRRMFPIDPNLADTSTVTSSQTSTCRDTFRGEVEGRDGSCVLTGDPLRRDAIYRSSEAAHLLPHSKGDTYIETFSIHRRRDSSSDDDIIRDINDVRNGLFLNASLHRVLGEYIAFLKTPNFAMDTTDVDANADKAHERFTSHLFDQSLERFAGPSGSAVRVPSDMSIWPPAALFDAVYASAVVKNFGFKPTDILEKWGGLFYPGRPTEAAHADDKRRRDQADADKENSNRQRQRRNKRRSGKGGIHDLIDPHDAVMIYRFLAMEPENVRAYLKGCEEVVAARERKTLEEKVNSWRESLAPVTDIAHGPVTHEASHYINGS